jgi:hypothetical protein
LNFLRKLSVRDDFLKKSSKNSEYKVFPSPLLKRQCNIIQHWRKLSFYPALGPI